MVTSIAKNICLQILNKKNIKKINKNQSKQPLSEPQANVTQANVTQKGPGVQSVLISITKITEFF